MKVKKALKRLNKIELLLSDVIDQFSANKELLGDSLETAKAAVIRAKESVNSQMSTTAARKASAKADTARPRRLAAGGRRKISLAAKKRGVVAKRKGMNTVAARRSSKTA